MFEVRIHGRGGQGVVTAAELLSIAAFLEGWHAQAFPTFAAERTGAPVVALRRIDDHEIRSREPVMRPNALIIQDATLLHQINLFEGLVPSGYLLINPARSFDGLGLGRIDPTVSSGADAGSTRHRARIASPRPAAAECRVTRRLHRHLWSDFAGYSGVVDP